MRLFAYDDRRMQYYQVRLFPLFVILLFLCTLVFLTTYKVAYNRGYIDCIDEDPVESTSILVTKSDIPEFSQDNLVELLRQLNVKHPHIVLAQAILETGTFNSDVFRQNHNLFGMKQAKIRVCTAKGTNLGHAYYDNWVESVYDYALYQSSYLRDLKSEDSYFNYLGSNYAEDPNYVKSLKRVIRKNNLKELFED